MFPYREYHKSFLGFSSHIRYFCLHLITIESVPSQRDLRIRTYQTNFHCKGSVRLDRQFSFRQLLFLCSRPPEPCFRTRQSIAYLTTLYGSTGKFLHRSLQRQGIAHGISLLYVFPGHFKCRSLVFFHTDRTRNFIRFNAEGTGQCFCRQLKLRRECTEIISRQFFSGDFPIIGIPQRQPNSRTLANLYRIALLRIGYSRHIDRLPFSIKRPVGKQIHPVGCLLCAVYCRQHSLGPIRHLHKIIFVGTCMHPQPCIHIRHNHFSLLVCAISLIFRIITWHRNRIEHQFGSCHRHPCFSVHHMTFALLSFHGERNHLKRRQMHHIVSSLILITIRNGLQHINSRFRHPTSQDRYRVLIIRCIR